MATKPRVDAEQRAGSLPRRTKDRVTFELPLADKAGKYWHVTSPKVVSPLAPEGIRTQYFLPGTALGVMDIVGSSGPGKTYSIMVKVST